MRAGVDVGVPTEIKPPVKLTLVTVPEPPPPPITAHELPLYLQRFTLLPEPELQVELEEASVT